MTTFLWIFGGGLLMSAIALVGSLTTVLQPAALERLLLPLVALAAGTLLGGALFHLIPEGMAVLGPLLLFGAGNFIYIGASDLVPEIKSHPSLAHAAASSTRLSVLAAGMPAPRATNRIRCQHRGPRSGLARALPRVASHGESSDGKQNFLQESENLRLATTVRAFG